MKNLLELIEAYCASVGCPEWLVNDISLVIVLLTTIGAIIGALYKGIKKLILWRNQRLLNKDLHPFYTPADVERATRYYIPLKHQNVAPSIDAELGSSYLSVAKEEIIPIFLKRAFRFGKDSNKYYLILADTGMGKTTFLINLYLAYKNQFNHLFSSKKYDIRLLPLGYPDVLEEIKKIENKNDTILLLDAFDEDIAAVKDYQARLATILEVVYQFREIVITCRTQFFPSEKEEPERTGYFSFGGQGEFKFQKSYLSVFDERDVKHYLRRRFSIFQYKKRQRALKIAQKSPTLVVRPMLLSHIEELVASDKEYRFTFEVYEELIKKWIEREARKPKVVQLYGNEENAKTSLYLFAERLAKYMYDHRVENGGYFLPKGHVFDKKMLALLGIDDPDDSFLERIAKTKSLLNRDAVGNYKFSHKSVMEYFIAKGLIYDAESFYQFDFNGMDATKMFVGELAEDKLSEIVFAPRIVPNYGYLKVDEHNKKITNLELGRQFTINFATKFPIHTLSAMENKKSIVLLDVIECQMLYNIYVSRFLDMYWSSSSDDYKLESIKRNDAFTNLTNKLARLDLKYIGNRLAHINHINTNIVPARLTSPKRPTISFVKDNSKNDIPLFRNLGKEAIRFIHELHGLDLIKFNNNKKDFTVEIKINDKFYPVPNHYLMADKSLRFSYKLDYSDLIDDDHLIKEFGAIDRFLGEVDRLKKATPDCEFIY